MLERLYDAGAGPAIGVLNQLMSEDFQLRHDGESSSEELDQALQFSPAMSTAALRLTLELQLLVAQQLRALQQQVQPAPGDQGCEQQENNSDHHQQQQQDMKQQNMADFWLDINKMLGKQVRTAFTVQAAACSSCCSSRGCCCCVRLLPPLELDQSGWLSQQLGRAAVNGSPHGAGEQLMLLKAACEPLTGEHLAVSGRCCHWRQLAAWVLGMCASVLLGRQAWHVWMCNADVLLAHVHHMASGQMCHIVPQLQMC
jgi:hypothetical protein